MSGGVGVGVGARGLAAMTKWYEFLRSLNSICKFFGGYKKISLMSDLTKNT